MKQYLLFILFAFLSVNAIYMYSSFEFLFNPAPYYIAGIVVLGIIVFFFRKKYGFSLIIIGILTFVSGEAIITYQESVSNKNAVKTIAIIEKYKEEKGIYPSEFKINELSLPKSIIGFMPHNFNYTYRYDSYSLDYTIYHGYNKYYESNTRKWIISD